MGFTEEERDFVEKSIELVGIRAELNLIEKKGDFDKNTKTLKLATSALEKVRKM